MLYNVSTLKYTYLIFFTFTTIGLGGYPHFTLLYLYKYYTTHGKYKVQCLPTLPNQPKPHGSKVCIYINLESQAGWYTKIYPDNVVPSPNPTQPNLLQNNVWLGMSTEGLDVIKNAWLSLASGSIYYLFHVKLTLKVQKTIHKFGKSM